MAERQDLGLETARRSPSVPPEAPGQAGLDGERLAAAIRAEVEERRRAVLLALAPMRSETALAAVQDGRVVLRNRRWADLAAQTDHPLRRADDGATEPAREYASLDALAVGEAEELLRTREPEVGRRFERDGAALFLDVRAESMILSSGGTLVLVVAGDATERVRRAREVARMQETMLERERLRIIGELASGVAHDLNNTLHALSLRILRLRTSRTVLAEQRENVEVIERIVSDASARVKRLQEIGRRREDRPDGTVDVARAIAEALGVAKLEMMGNGARIRVEVRLPPLGMVAADADELHQVFVGLLVNARDALAGAGRIRVEGHRDGEWVVVTFADDGPGIRQEHLRRIFDPFFTTKGRRGSGLGLAIADGVMRRLGGRIDASNGPAGGAVFTLRFPPLPAQARRGVSPRAPAATSLERLPPRRVLVVDDDQDNLDAARWILEEMGQHVEVAASGSDAIGRSEAGERYDLVLCDLGMPGLNGWDVALRLREIAPATPVYLVTGWAQELGPDDPRRANVAGILPKPIDVGELGRIVRGAGSEPLAREDRLA